MRNALDALCYGGWGLVHRQLDDLVRLVAANTREELVECKFRSWCWKNAIRARFN